MVDQGYPEMSPQRIQGEDNDKETAKEFLQHEERWFDEMTTRLKWIREYRENASATDPELRTQTVMMDYQPCLEDAVKEEVRKFFKCFLDGLINPDRLSNKKLNGDYRPCEVFEWFCCFYFNYIKTDLVSLPLNLKAVHHGRAGDKGVDVTIHKNMSPITVIQVKLGKYFYNRKGTFIMNALLGTMVNHCVYHGILFTNEKREELDKSPGTLDIVSGETRKNRPFSDFKPVVFCYDDIIKYAEGDIEGSRELLINFIDHLSSVKSDKFKKKKCILQSVI